MQWEEVAPRGTGKGTIDALQRGVSVLITPEAKVTL
jgi:hypothetical protein